MEFECLRTLGLASLCSGSNGLTFTCAVLVFDEAEYSHPITLRDTAQMHPNTTNTVNDALDSELDEIEADAVTVEPKSPVTNCVITATFTAPPDPMIALAVELFDFAKPQLQTTKPAELRDALQ